MRILVTIPCFVELVNDAWSFNFEKLEIRIDFHDNKWEFKFQTLL